MPIQNKLQQLRDTMILYKTLSDEELKIICKREPGETEALLQKGDKQYTSQI